jgi:hypothetical protein
MDERRYWVWLPDGERKSVTAALLSKVFHRYPTAIRIADQATGRTVYTATPLRTVAA